MTRDAHPDDDSDRDSTDDYVPPAKQCSLPGCTGYAVDPGKGAVCSTHLPSSESEETTDKNGTEITPDTIREHYQQARPVFEALADVDGHQTIGLNDFSGWYITRDEHNVKPLEAGYDKRRRPASLATDLDEVLDRLDRTLYALTSYKDRRAFTRWESARLDEEAGTYEYRSGENPTPDPADLQAMAVWGDIDLADHLKPQRGDLDEETRATAEAALDAYIEEFAQLYGGRDAIYALDSVGGAYVFGAPEATLPIAEYVREQFDDETAGTVLRELIERSNNYLQAAQERVEDRIENAADVIDPDWANNHNRQYKAPLSIHKDHAAVVTPLDVDDVDYSVTPLDAVDDQLVAETTAWAQRFTAVEYTDRARALVETLWPDEYDQADDWRGALEAWIEHHRQQAQQRDDLRDHATGDTGDAGTIDTDADVTADIREVKAAVDALDPFAVAEETVVHRWTEDLPDAEDRSGAGKRAFVPTWGTNYSSGNANYIDEKGSWVDTANDDHGTVVELALIDAGGWTRGQIARGADWFRGLDELRKRGFDIPVWVPEADQDDQTPYWALRRAAIALDVVDPDDLVEREGDDGETYRAFPDRETYHDAVEALEAQGIDTGRTGDPRDDQTCREYRPDPRDVDVVLDPERAWEAAGRVQPWQLDRELSLESTDDKKAWRCPTTGARIDGVARAVAIAEGLIADAHEPLSTTYATAYTRARDHYGAPLPVYRTQADTISRYDYVLGAVRELTFWHLDRDAFTVEITGEGDDVDGEATLTLDPTPLDGWRDSDSGESVLVFPSGTVWDADTETVIDALRFVALDAGLIDDPTAPLEGDRFTQAYRIARSEYDAPLPRWNAGDPDVTPILPPADQLIEHPEVETDRLDALRTDVEQLYRRIIQDDDGANLLRALPALGKTTTAIKTAADHPTTYCAARKELMQQAAKKAERWDVSWTHLPIFSEERIDNEVLDEAIAHVREHGKDRLRDRWAILDAVDEEIWAEADDEEDEVCLCGRATCPTAEGEHGPAWALAVHVARALDYTPRDIHTRANALFGAELPCQEDGDCAYTTGWNDIADPDTQIDLLIGHYTHAHVESARTHYEPGPRGEGVTRSPRVLVLDEFPGTAFSESFGEEALDHAVWLASALHDGVQDRQDLYEHDLWTDPFVNAWLDGTAGEEGNPAHEPVQALRARRQAHEAAMTAQEIREEYQELLNHHDLAEPLQRVACYDELTGGERSALAGEIATTIDRVSPDARGFTVLQWIAEDVAGPLAAAARSLDVELAELPGSGELRQFVERSIEAATERHEDAAGMLQAAEQALSGGDEGIRELAVWADDGYAHRQAHYLLETAIRPDDSNDTARIETEEFTFGSDADQTVIKHATIGEDITVLLDRNHHGAEILDPPSWTAGNGEQCPLVGLDATGRAPLWKVAIGQDITIQDIHDTPQERAECLREVHRLQLVQTSDVTRSYEGDPDGKNLDADVALLEHIHDQFTGVHAARERDQDDIVLDSPATITTDVVQEVLEDDPRLDDIVSTWEHYGNLKGSNDLADHQLAALLGCQHYGDEAVEQFAALAGEEVDRQGYGTDLDYNSEIANEYLGHMREDQVMQAALRFARGDSGAIVFAHTAALRADLPVVGEGQVIKSWSETATTIAREWQRAPGESFTAADVADAVDVTDRQVRRVLAEFVDAGYLQCHDPGEGLANDYTSVDTPGAGEVEFEADLSPSDTAGPGQESFDEVYTANVRVTGVTSGRLPHTQERGSQLPAPQVSLTDKNVGTSG